MEHYNQNTQPASPYDHGDGSRLLLHSFFPTVQGEGPRAGQRAVFVRLAGCNLRCPMCDTEYTRGARWAAVANIINSVSQVSGGGRLVVLTGGEPFRQNVLPLIRDLRGAGFVVQVETNGVLRPPLGMRRGDAEVVVSPKTGSVHRAVEEIATAYKYVVDSRSVARDGLPTRALDHPLGRYDTVARPPADFEGLIYVNPADVVSDERDTRRDNYLNRQAARSAVLSGDDRFRLGVQIHKLYEME